MLFVVSDMGVGDELSTVIGQVTRGIAGQGPVVESRNLVHDALPHRKPVQLAKHRRDVITSPDVHHVPGCSVLNWLHVSQVTINIGEYFRSLLSYLQLEDKTAELQTKQEPTFKITGKICARLIYSTLTIYFSCQSADISLTHKHVELWIPQQQILCKSNCHM